MIGPTLRRFTIAASMTVGLMVGLSAPAGAEDWRPVPQSCVSATGTGGQCTTLRSAGGLWNLAIAPGGTTAYGTAWNESTVVIFDRNPSNGQLTQRAGTAGCVSDSGSGGQCVIGRGLGLSDAAVVSPDGRQVYVGGWSGGIAVFDRNVTTGALTQKAGTAGCLTFDGSGGCSTARGLGAARDIVISPDGANVYVGGDSIVVLNRNATTGVLTQQAGTAGCIVASAASGCGVGNAIGFHRQLALTPDGRSLYVPSLGGALAVFDRDTSTGSLAQKAGIAGCLSTNGSGGQCATEPRLSSALTALSAPDGRSVYVSAGSAILVFARAADGKLALQSCLNDLGTANCTNAKLSFPGYLTLSPDGADLVANSNSNGLVMFERNATTGDLTQRSGPDVCVTTTGDVNDNGATVVGGCRAHSAVGVNGRPVFGGPNQFYAGFFGASSIVAFKRDYYPVCPDQSVSTAQNTSIAVAFGCSDRNGDPLTYAITADPVSGNLGAIDQGGARVFYNPFGGFIGSDTFKFTASAGTLSSPATTISLNVAPGAGGGGGGGGGTVQPAGIDSDKDGFFAGQDCNDGNAAIRPGAVEVKGNRLDENCDGLAEPFPTLTSGVASKWDVKGSRLTLASLQVTQQFPKGWKVLIKCSGKPKCSFRSKSLKAGKVKRGASTVISSLSKKQRKFRAGQTLEVWVSAPSFNTKVARLVLRKGKVPTTQPFCVLPGQTKVQKTCS